jgi:alkylation response protein AidB-like acyl-CoA dehydrogenase
MQIFGAYGYTIEYGLEREMRDALACSVYSGTNEMQRNTIYTMAMLDIQ